MIHTDRITLVFPIAAKNRAAAASLQTLEITESGREFETVVPLDPALVNSYASEFNLSALIDLDAEKTAHSATKQTLIEAQAEIAELTAEVARLTALIPPAQGPRQLTPNEFMMRMVTVAPKHVREIWSSDSEAAVMAATTLFTTIGFIDLDSPRLAALLAGLIQAGLLSQTERDEILK